MEILTDGSVVLTSDEYETLCFNFETYKNDAQRFLDLYGKCLLDYNLLLDKYYKLKGVQDEFYK